MGTYCIFGLRIDGFYLDKLVYKKLFPRKISSTKQTLPNIDKPNVTLPNNTLHQHFSTWGTRTPRGTWEAFRGYAKYKKQLKKAFWVEFLIWGYPKGIQF